MILAALIQAGDQPRRLTRFKGLVVVRSTGRHWAQIRHLVAGTLSVAFVTTAIGAGLNPARGATYDNTNPGATPCGDGSHPVETVRSFLIRQSAASSLRALARVDIRWSKFCNTVWTRAVNVTGSGNGYASERSLTADETIFTYNCPKVACLRQTQTETGDLLPTRGASGWSHQFVLPPNGNSAGNPPAKQPPTVRGIVRIRDNSNGAIYSLDTNLEPFWTWHANDFRNERNLRDGNSRTS